MTYGNERKVILTTDSFCSKLKRRHNAIILFAFGKITYISEAIFAFDTQKKEKNIETEEQKHLYKTCLND